jgi:LPS sulfotransferase NodH
MTNPLAQILDFPDAESIDKYLRSAMTDPYAAAARSAQVDREGINYIICYVQRSGSTHLTSLLQNTGLAGKPADFLNAAYAGLPLENRQVAQRTGAVTIVDAVREYGIENIAEYLEVVSSLTRTPNGVFGLKVDLAHASSLLRSRLFNDRGWNWNYIYLTRRDLLMQAISYHAAMQTGRWSSLSVGTRSAMFDQRSLTEFMLQLADFMGRWECIFSLFEIDPIRVQYEQIEADARSTVLRCLQVLGVSADATHLPITSAYGKQRSADAETWSAAMIASARQYRAT